MSGWSCRLMSASCGMNSKARSKKRYAVNRRFLRREFHRSFALLRMTIVGEARVEAENPMTISDKFHDECGVVAIYSHPEAETLAYLGLHSLQHRGQESAGIVTSDGMSLHIHKAMGLVADIFTEKKLSRLRGTLAIGHTRYSTTGDSALLNAQPIMVQSNKGMIALAHNGNLTNAQEIRSRMEAQGTIFQTR